MSPHPEIGRGHPALGGCRLKVALLCSSVLTCVSSISSSALAQAISVPDGTNLSTLSAPTATTIWNLLGNAYVSNGTTTPVAIGVPSGMSINGAAGGSTITLNDGAGHYGYFSSPFNTTLNLSNVTFTGGLRTASGGAITTTATLTLNTTGTITFSNNQATNVNGGAIFSTSSVSVTGDLTASNNSAGLGGAIYSTGNVSIGNAASTVTLTGNTASSFAVPGSGAGGAIYVSSGTVTIDGTEITMANNSTAQGSGGAIYARGGGVSVGSASTSTVTLTGNISGTGGAGAGGVILTDSGPVTINGSVITVTNNSSPAGGAINAGGDVSIGTAGSANTITLSGNSAYYRGGVIYSFTGVTIGNTGSTITLTNNSSTGGSVSSAGAIYANNGPTTLNGIDITVTGNNSAGGWGGAIYASGNVSIGNAGSTHTVTLASNTVGYSGGAIRSDSAVTLNGSEITVSDNSVVGSSSSAGPGGAIYAAGNVSIGNAGSTNTVMLSGNSTPSFGGNGGAIYSTGAVTIDGTQITINDNSSAGGLGGTIYATGNISIGNTGSTVTMSGNSAASSAGAIDGLSTVTINGSHITVTNNSTGGSGGAINASNFVLNATGPSQFSGNVAGASGGAIWASGNVTLNAASGDIIFSGNTMTGTSRANAIYLNNTGGATTTTFNVAAGSTIAFFDPIQSNAANGRVTVAKTGAGTVAFDGSLHTTPTDRLSQVYAITTVQNGSFVVDNNAVYGALATDVTQTTPSSFTVDAGATLAGGIAGEVRADDLALNGSLNIAGSAPPGDASGGFSTFTVTSHNVSFGAGSQVLFNTYLNDASIQRTDLLTLNLNGTATSGTAGIFVTNVGGPGGLTTDNGIELVQVTNNNGTTTGAFTLGNPELRPGAFDYRLFHGSLDTSGPENWYLRSTFVEVTPEPPPPEPPPPVTPPGVLPPTPPTPGPGLFPIIGPEIATYGVVQPMAQQLGRAMLGTHDDRLGDLYLVPCEPNAPIYTKAPPLYTKAPTDCADGWRPAVWGRLFGQQVDNHYQAFADPRTDGQIAGLQAGIDLLRSDSLIPGHKDYGGLYFAYGNANVDVTGLVTNAAATAYVLQHTGALNLNAYSGGAYWTHYGVSGWYVDLTLQGTSYSSAASTEFARLDTNGSGFISSLEGGFPIALPQLGFGFVLEPQAQVLWQWVSFDAGNDGLGPVALGTTSTTTARVGLKGKWTITTDSAQVWQPYVRTNFWSDFGGTAATMFGVDSAPLISHAQYMDVGGGLTTKINAHLSAFADTGYQFAVSNDGGGKRDGVKGTAGLRYQW